MKDQNQKLDDLLKDGLQPSEASVQRVRDGVARGLRQTAPSVDARRPWLGYAAIAAMTLISVSAFVFLLRERGFPEPLPPVSADPPEPTAALVFDSDLPLLVWIRNAEGLWELKGHTPSEHWQGIRIPAGAVWKVSPEPQQKLNRAFFERLAAEVRARKLAAVSLLEQWPNPERTLVGGADALKPMAGIESLRSFEICDASDETLELVAQIPNLEDLKIEYGKFTAAGLAKLKALPLKRLNIFRTSGDEVLAGLAGHPTLQELELPLWSDAGLEFIGKIPNLASLRSHSDKLTDAGLKHLFGLQHLTQLDLSGARIGEETLKAFAGFKPALLHFGEYSYIDPQFGPRTLASPVFEKLPWADRPGPAALKPEEEQALAPVFNALDSEDYQVRKDANSKLVALGYRCMPSLQAWAKRLEDNHELTTALRSEVEQVVEGINSAGEKEGLSQREMYLDDALAQFNRHPGNLGPRDKHLKLKLSRRISFEFVDTNVKDALEHVSKYVDVPILIDPAIENGLVPVSLKVQDMSAELALSWINRVADLTMSPCGKVLIIRKAASTPDGNLLEELVFELPVAQGEEVWTVSETKALGETLPPLSITHDWNSGDDSLSLSTVRFPEAGKVAVTCSKPDLLQNLLEAFKNPPVLKAAAPQWIQAYEAQLDEPRALNFENVQADEVVARLARNFQGELLVDPVLLKEGLPSVSIQAKTAREALVAICAKAHASLVYSNGILLMTQKVPMHLPAAAYVLDLRPAFKLGVNSGELEASLNALFKDVEGNLPQNAGPGTVVRGRWLVRCDPWTASRAAQLLEATVKAGKLASAPPAPWFFKTFAFSNPAK